MSSQTSQPPGMILPQKLPHSSLVTLASRLVPETSSPGLGHKTGRKEKYLKAKVLISFEEIIFEIFLFWIYKNIFQIVDPLQVYDNINLGRRIDPLWPDELWRSRGGRNSWKDWLPEEDMEGTVRKQKLILNFY